MNKKVLIGSGVAAFIIGAVVGLYYYTKKSINKIAVAIDDTFDIEDDNNTIQCQFDLTKTNKNGSSCAKNAFIPIPKEEENQKETIRIHNFKWGHIEPLSIKQQFDEMFKEKCENCPCKKNEKPAFQYLFDDQFYKDYIDTINAFQGDDGK